MKRELEGLRNGVGGPVEGGGGEEPACPAVHPPLATGPLCSQRQHNVPDLL